MSSRGIDPELLSIPPGSRDVTVVEPIDEIMDRLTRRMRCRMGKVNLQLFSFGRLGRLAKYT